MKKIKIETGQTLIVDDGDYERVKAKRWAMAKNGFIFTWDKDSCKPISVGRFVLGEIPGRFVKHRDRNKLNARRENVYYTTSRRKLNIEG